ncbi:hypothetical protein BDV93DRAFT_506199 [Ceratobasidium sp. AG-I]|nr:hypothetical protein BDV93DRAFT_506199 [Ceratobasidium sp. AG-I]
MPRTTSILVRAACRAQAWSEVGLQPVERSGDRCIYLLAMDRMRLPRQDPGRHIHKHCHPTTPGNPTIALPIDLDYPCFYCPTVLATNGDRNQHIVLSVPCREAHKSSVEGKTTSGSVEWDSNVLDAMESHEAKNRASSMPTQPDLLGEVYQAPSPSQATSSPPAHKPHTLPDKIDSIRPEPAPCLLSLPDDGPFIDRFPNPTAGAPINNEQVVAQSKAVARATRVWECSHLWAQIPTNTCMRAAGAGASTGFGAGIPQCPQN